jgi:hypothetical protein
MIKNRAWLGRWVCTALLVFVLLTFTHVAFSQTPDSTKAIQHVSGTVSLTNNGISLIPTFSLGKPAVLLLMSVGNRKLTFEPDIRFALEGKPWSFLFWWRYKLVTTDRISVRIGAHPALNFRTMPVAINGVPTDAIVSRRFLAGEIAPSYLLSKNVSVGMYYLYSRGFDPNVPNNTHFLTLNSSFADIKLTNQFFMRVSPQLYYLKQDAQDGFYVTSVFSLAKRNSPFSLSAIVNKTIQTDIAASKDFVWSANLIYSFHKEYVRK